MAMSAGFVEQPIAVTHLCMQTSWHSPIHCILSLVAALELQIQLSSASSSEYVRLNILGVQLPQTALPWSVDTQVTGPEGSTQCTYSQAQFG